MARPRSNSPQRKGRGTSFGKKSDVEKTFRKRKFSSRSGRNEGDKSSTPFNDNGKPASFNRGPGGFKRPGDGPFGKGRSSDFGSERPGFKRSSGKPFRSRPDGDRGEGRPFPKKEGGPFASRPGGSGGFPRPFKTEGDEEKRSYRKSGPSFGGPERGGFKKTYRKSEGTARPSRDDGSESKPFNRGEGKSFDRREKKPYVRGEGKSFDRGEKKPFVRGEGKSFDDRDKKPFVRREKRSFDGADKKPFERSERKSFVQSRVTSADFVRPGKKSSKTQEEVPAGDGLIRLNRFIANSGVGSRREADELIKMGLISINGTTITTLGTKVKPGDVVRYEDRILKAEKPVYILLNKPKGFITTTEDPEERSTVMGLVAGACKERVYPVGRLDRNTTGLLLLTNDGDLADKLTHPSYKAKKVYKVELDRPLTKNDFKKIQEGIVLEEGRAMVDDVAIISEDDKTVGLEIHIGWNRVIRRIFETLGYDVVKLDRSVFAGLDKKDLSRGQWRFLKPEEVVRLKHFN